MQGAFHRGSYAEVPRKVLLVYSLSLHLIRFQKFSKLLGTSFLNTIILLGAVQGFIISILMFVARKNRQSNRLLSVLIFLMSLASFNLYAIYKNCFDSDSLRFLSNFIPMVVVMPFGPLLYLYIQSLLDKDFGLTKPLRFHFYPVIIDIVPQLTALIYVTGVSAGVLKKHPQPWVDFIDNYNIYSDIPRWMSVSVYVWLSAKYLSAYTQKQANAASGGEKNVGWLRQFIRLFSGFQIIWFLFLIPYVIPKYSNSLLDSLGWYPVYIPLAIMIYWLGIKGYVISQAETQVVKKLPAAPSAITADIISKTIASLKKSVGEDKLFLNPDLNLTLLSEHTAIPPKTISYVLNQSLHKNISEFVNDYRIEAFKEKVLQPETSHLTIAGIASECGFSSQATFQRLFKQATGISPSEFRKSVLQTG